MRQSTYRTPSDLIGLSIVLLVVGCISITAHGHDVRKYSAWSIVLVGVEEKTEALELVCMTEDISGLRALLGEPHGKAVAVEISLSMDLKLECDLLA